MCKLARLRIWAHGWQLGSIHLEGQYVVLGYKNRRQLDLLVARSSGQLRIADDQSAYLPLGKEIAEPEQDYRVPRNALAAKLSRPLDSRRLVLRDARTRCF